MFWVGLFVKLVGEGEHSYGAAVAGYRQGTTDYSPQGLRDELTSFSVFVMKNPDLAMYARQNKTTIVNDNLSYSRLTLW